MSLSTRISSLSDVSPAKIITVSGKGGVGKTTLTALLVDELSRSHYQGRLLVVDGDPAMTLHLVLGQEPPLKTIADVRDETSLSAKVIRRLSAGVSPEQYVADRLKSQQVLTTTRQRAMPFDLLAMGWGEGRPGCYCAINNVLGHLLTQLLSRYDLILVDCEAGLEHLSRFRLTRSDLFVTLTDGSRAARQVADRALQVAQSVGMTIGAVARVEQLRPGDAAQPEPEVIPLPFDAELQQLTAWGDITALPANNPVRTAVKLLVLKSLQLGGHDPAERIRAALAPVQGG